MATAAKKKKAPVVEKQERGMSYKDIQIVFLADGIGKVEKMLNAGLVSKSTLRRAAESFGTQAHAQTFVDFVKGRVGVAGTGKRGRKPPVKGDARVYKAQRVGDGLLFIRLPVNALVTKKGGEVTVAFEGDRIVVRAA